MRGDPERIILWAQVIAGIEVDALTAVRVLDARRMAETPRAPGETRRFAGGVSYSIGHASKPNDWEVNLLHDESPQC